MYCFADVDDDRDNKSKDSGEFDVEFYKHGPRRKTA